MPFRRLRRRRWIALVALLGLLYQQLAMAAYVCPMEVGSRPTVEAPCHQPDTTDKVRCETHCHPVTTSPDRAPAPTVPPALLPATTWWRAPIEAVWRHAWLVRFDVPVCAASPPLTVQYCTFQI